MQIMLKNSLTLLKRFSTLSVCSSLNESAFKLAVNVSIVFVLFFISKKLSLQISIKKNDEKVRNTLDLAKFKKNHKKKTKKKWLNL